MLGLDKLKIGELVRVDNTNAIIEVLEVLPKDIMRPREIKGKVIKSIITEDKGQIFEYNINYLSMITKDIDLENV